MKTPSLTIDIIDRDTPLHDVDLTNLLRICEQTALNIVAILEHASHLTDEFNREEANLAALAKLPRCNGNVYWQQHYMYVNHTRGSACPLHGRHKSGGRLRTNIGADPITSRQPKTHPQLPRLERG